MPERQQPIHVAGQSLAGIAALAAQRRLPPVQQWDPPLCGHSGMRIARDGSWFHEGRRIDRPAMVRLFSTVLRKERDGSHVLVTPAEKLTIDVELAPFVVTAMTSEGSGPDRGIALELSSGDAVLLGPEHPLRLEGEMPLLHVRDGLEASFARPVYYELASIALDENGDPPGVWGGGIFFPLQPA